MTTHLQLTPRTRGISSESSTSGGYRVHIQEDKGCTYRTIQGIKKVENHLQPRHPKLFNCLQNPNILHTKNMDIWRSSKSAFMCMKHIYSISIIYSISWALYRRKKTENMEYKQAEYMVLIKPMYDHQLKHLPSSFTLSIDISCS